MNEKNAEVDREVCFLIEFCVDESILTRLQEDLGKYKRILLISSSLKCVDSFSLMMEAYLKEEMKYESNLLLLIWEGFSMSISGITVRAVSEQEERELIALYRLYDCSDRFRVWSDDRQCGTVINYVKNGIITWNEAFQIMLGGE